jgi:PAS domain-containing protein
MLATPLIAKGEVRGIMTLDHSQARHYFTSKEINVVMGISNQLGLALENARLLKDIEAAEGRMGIGLDILSDGLISLAGDFTVELVSSKAVELLGIPPTIVGKPWIDVLTIKDEAGKELSEEDLVAMIPKNRDGFSDSRRIHLEVRGGKGLPFFLRLLSIPDRDRVGRVVLVLRKAPLPRGPPSLPPPPGEPVLDEAMQRF